MNFYENHYMNCNSCHRPCHRRMDSGANPVSFSLEASAKNNSNFRTALWTGESMQLTVMCLNPEEEIGLECHEDIEQLIYIEEGTGCVMMGSSKCNLSYQAEVCEGYAIIIPSGVWHNLINTGEQPLKLHSVYAPPAHPFGTIHTTKECAERAERYLH